MLVTLPFVLLLLDYWPLRRMQKEECRRQNEKAGTALAASRSALLAPRSTLYAPLLGLLAEKLPFFLAAAVFSGVTFVVQKQGEPSSPACLSRIASPTLLFLIAGISGSWFGRRTWPPSIREWNTGQWPQWPRRGCCWQAFRSRR